MTSQHNGQGVSSNPSYTSKKINPSEKPWHQRFKGPKTPKTPKTREGPLLLAVDDFLSPCFYCSVVLDIADIDPMSPSFSRDSRFGPRWCSLLVFLYRKAHLNKHNSDLYKSFNLHTPWSFLGFPRISRSFLWVGT